MRRLAFELARAIRRPCVSAYAIATLASIAIVLGRSGRGGLAAVDAISWVQLALRDKPGTACA
ncbi:hypothetical protein, partial [Scytonema millei]|uniref:hypothetical protein n=1 Tax=Scytonema millei TaxID=1245922 RepID=UPI00398C0234